MAVRVKLTLQQYRQLGRHFKAVNFSYYDLGVKGALLAQVHEGHGEPYMKVRFFSAEYGDGLNNAIIGPLPYGFGIPAVSEEAGQGK